MTKENNGSLPLSLEDAFQDPNGCLKVLTVPNPT